MIPRSFGESKLRAAADARRQLEESAKNAAGFVGGLAVAFGIVALLKFHDVSIVRRAAPDLGFAESFFWPLDEPRDEILYSGCSRDPDAETRRRVVAWVEGYRRGERPEIGD